MKLRKLYVCDIPQEELNYIVQNCSADLEVEEITISALPEVEAEEGMFIASSQKDLDNAKEVNFATVGFQKPDSAVFLHADMVVEGFEEVDAFFLERVWRRHHRIPWHILETNRLIVRELGLEDLDALFELYENKKMAAYLDPLYSYEEEKKYQESYINNMYEFYGYGMWLVFEKKSGKLIGRAGIEHREESNFLPEIGYAIGDPYQQKGYAAEVCQAILEYAKEELCFEEMLCFIEPENEVSIHLAKRLGFEFLEAMEIEGVELHKFWRSLN